VTTPHAKPEQNRGGTAESKFRVARADNGFEVSMQQLIRTGEEPLLWSVDERMRLVKRRMTRRISTRRRELYRLRLASGRQLEVASAHRIRKVDGWKPVAELVVGSRVAALRRLSEPAQPKRMHESR